jgi:hypothetical protein
MCRQIKTRVEINKQTEFHHQCTCTRRYNLIKIAINKTEAQSKLTSKLKQELKSINKQNFIINAHVLVGMG